MTNLCVHGHGAKEEMLLRGRKAACDHPRLWLEFSPPLPGFTPKQTRIVSICRKIAGIWRGRLNSETSQGLESSSPT